MRKIAFLLSLFLTLFSPLGYAVQRNKALLNFTVKENLIKNNKMAIIACDSLGEPTDQLNGTFTFSVNGFKQTLSFRDGIAVSPLEIERSAFVFIKHINEQETQSKLYYVLKNEDGLHPIQINWMLILVIPLGLLLIAFMFRRLLVFAVIAFLALMYFNHRSGLSLDGFFETVVDGIKDML